MSDINLKPDEMLIEVPGDYAIGNVFRYKQNICTIVELGGTLPDGSKSRIIQGSYFNVPKASGVDYKKNYSKLAIVKLEGK